MTKPQVPVYDPFETRRGAYAPNRVDVVSVRCRLVSSPSTRKRDPWRLCMSRSMRTAESSCRFSQMWPSVRAWIRCGRNLRIFFIALWYLSAPGASKNTTVFYASIPEYIGLASGTTQIGDRRTPA